MIRLKFTGMVFLAILHLVNTILHLSLLTAAKLGAGASSVWREAASSYLERFEKFSFCKFEKNMGPADAAVTDSNQSEKIRSV